MATLCMGLTLTGPGSFLTVLMVRMKSCLPGSISSLSSKHSGSRCKIGAGTYSPRFMKIKYLQHSSSRTSMPAVQDSTSSAAQATATGSIRGSVVKQIGNTQFCYLFASRGRSPHTSQKNDSNYLEIGRFECVGHQFPVVVCI
uniref:Secreted protein n=1 Tax=Populus alba TaxID=43335 RepID=A0A4U5PZY8_POPAL|nr:hypothetical protein D5086_0000159700 [Populus alba]